MSPAGVVKAMPWFTRIASTIREVRLSLSLPKGAMPPFFTDTLGSGTKVAGSTCATLPNPLQVGHAP